VATLVSRADPLPLAAGAVAAHADEVALADVALVDVGVDAQRALEVCEELARERPDLPVTAVVCCPTSMTAWGLRHLFETGVTSVIDLEATPLEFRRALRTVADGGSVFSVHLRRGQRALLREALTSRGPRPETSLHLLELVAIGLPDHEIGRRLHLSPHTVKHRIEDLRTRVGARNRVELAAWAGRHGLYAPESAGAEVRPLPAPRQKRA
jgi:DNA-binding NarL/FixJ family response regulator